jgi:mono/diheme cytochrome c family protein
MRLVSTRNGIPTLADIKRVIREGIAGTSMVAMEELTDHQLDQLAAVVREMRRDGIRQQYVALLRQDGEPIDDEDVQETVEIQSSPGESVVAPMIPPSNPESVERGKELYIQQTCHSCHGLSGEGDETTALFDEKGRPSFPRDLVHDWFKGGNNPESIYLRILLGMPGSPHPANVNLTQDKLVDLVHFCESLGRDPKHDLTNHQRENRASTRPATQFTTSP